MRFSLRSRMSALGAVLSLALAGCISRPTDPSRPMATTWHRAQAEARAERLLVLLPGRWDTRADFERQGLLEVLRRGAPTADAVAVEATLPYYRDQTIVTRLRDEVIKPARAQGYREIWLVGVSMGGLGSLFYLRDHADDIAGVILLAPYVGDDRALLAEIKTAGGPQTWTPGPAPRAPEERHRDFQRELWRFLQKLPEDPPIWVAFGERDRLRPGIDLFTTLLPPERVLRLPGGHDWPVWRTGFEQLLPQALR